MSDAISVFDYPECFYKGNILTYVEPQYNVFDDYESRYGLFQLGPMASFTYNRDPKRLLFVLARYKFVSKMFTGFSNVLEVGCGDGFGSRVVRQHVEKLVVTDFDNRLLDHIRKQQAPPGLELIPVNWNPSGNYTLSASSFDGVFALDVIEHVPSHLEENFMEQLARTLKHSGSLILGSPSIESQTYASVVSKAGHVNCKSAEALASLVKRFFRIVHIFSMNDEVVHTGFSRMSHYNFVVCGMPIR